MLPGRSRKRQASVLSTRGCSIGPAGLPHAPGHFKSRDGVQEFRSGRKPPVFGGWLIRKSGPHGPSFPWRLHSHGDPSTLSFSQMGVQCVGPQDMLCIQDSYLESAFQSAGSQQQPNAPRSLGMKGEWIVCGNCLSRTSTVCPQRTSV